ncbi:unnamed protein product [Phytophthora fragariaefolia]|uniref:Unnamed protein product n=1 Tax=Phytophthora fragariaefolia TaxID=1490495 RepID=A0A9W6YCD4_9STRA|nr:unnamed protein product [Phytophthora fragariaefolia]
MALDWLAAAGLTLKLKNCVFAAESMEYLGHTLSADGVQPVDRLIKAVEAFGSIAAPLAKLLKKDAEWCWTE